MNKLDRALTPFILGDRGFYYYDFAIGGGQFGDVQFGGGQFYHIADARAHLLQRLRHVIHDDSIILWVLWTLTAGGGAE